MRIVSTTGASHLLHSGEEFSPDDAGVFEVPEPIGVNLTQYPTWVPEHEAVDRAAADQRARDTDAAVQAARIADLEAAVADLAERLAALEDGGEDGDGAEPKPKRGRKPAEPIE